MRWVCLHRVRMRRPRQWMPKPLMRHARIANHMCRRARQFSDLGVRFRAIHPAHLTVIGHADVGLENADGLFSQGGFIIGFVERKIALNATSMYTPATWKSYRLRKMTAATLGAEAQVAHGVAKGAAALARVEDPDP